MCSLLAVSPGLRATYESIIDSILAKSDLQTVSEKRIRKGLQDELGYDLTPQKVSVNSSYRIVACVSDLFVALLIPISMLTLL